MTRYLSQVLGAVEPRFGHSIEELERASGRPSADIRLSAEMMQKARRKMLVLGLDPADTTGPELYNALHERLRQDERRVREALGISDDTSANDVIEHVQQFLTTHDMPRQCFALKASVAKRLLKKKPPKVTMKALGYRSFDSLLKHEPCPQVLALAQLAESATWQRQYKALYAKLQPTDFESREIVILAPQSKRWIDASSKYVHEAKHNIACFKEFGTVVMLPLETAVDGLALTSLLIVLNQLNDIRSYSSYAKLQQVKTNFGEIIQHTVDGEPYTSARLVDQPVSWRMIQHFYGRNPDAYHSEVFEPHVQPEDLHWHDAEGILTALEPTLGFWQSTQNLCLLHEGQPVSFNALDVALSYCNHLPYADRIVHFVRDHVWHELMMRYLNQGNLEEAVTRQLSHELIDQTALAE